MFVVLEKMFVLVFEVSEEKIKRPGEDAEGVREEVAGYEWDTVYRKIK